MSTSPNPAMSDSTTSHQSPDQPPLRFAFVKRGRFSYCNPRFLAAFESEMAPCAVKVLDVWEHLVGPRDLLNVAHAVMDYGKRIVGDPWSLRDCMTRSPRHFHRLRRKIRKTLSAETGLAFTFQMQSLFDASVPGIPNFVYTDHTHLTNLYYPSHDPESLFPEKWIACERQIYQNARMVFTMGSHVARSLVEHYGLPEEKVRHIYQGSNVNEPEEAPDPSRYQSRRIVFVGIDWERKGGPQILQAFEKVLTKVPDARLTIVGCSPEVNVPNVDVAGLIPPEEVGRHYVEASVYVMPTRIEPAGAACNEAMLYRLPVVASNVGALPDRVKPGETGYLVDPDDITGFAERLTEFLLDPEKARRFGEAGYAFAKTTYTWENSARLARESILACLENS